MRKRSHPLRAALFGAVMAGTVFGGTSQADAINVCIAANLISISSLGNGTITGTNFYLPGGGIFTADMNMDVAGGSSTPTQWDVVPYWNSPHQWINVRNSSGGSITPFRGWGVVGYSC